MTISVNPLTGENCVLPDALDDYLAINKFWVQNSGKK